MSTLGSRGSLAWVIGWLTAGAVGADDAGGLSSFEHDPGIRISVFATEPQVIDPVALCFSADGACYVAEMRDFPLGMGPGQPAGGVVRRLVDRDGDGRADESKVFAEHLSYPTSITIWRAGVLVAAPPEIVYLEDADGDGVAEIRRTVARGFPQGLTDSNFNGLRFGFDGWIHGVNGGNGGRITSPKRPKAGVELGRFDFALDPDRGQVVTTAETGGGFGLVFDDWGRSFTAHNTDYLQQRAIPQRYFESIPSAQWLGPFTTFIARDGHETRLYPIGTVVTRVNHPEQAGHYSAGAAPCVMGGSLFGADWARSILTCDVAAGVVHRDDLQDDGAVAVAVAANANGNEFLASRDTSFRPTALEHGPDGAIYLADMQRDVIEHPDYIPAHVRQTLDLRAGDTRGRIYRIIPAAGLPPGGGGLLDAGIPAWVEALKSPIPWRRETAHRLLFERRPPDAIALLRVLAHDETAPVARVRALWILDAIGKLEAASVTNALQAGAIGVREAALQLAERQPSAAVRAAVLPVLGDPVPRVRFQAALTLGRLGGPERIEPLLGLLRDSRDEWLIKAALIGIGLDAPKALGLALSDERSRAHDRAMEGLARLAASTLQPLPFLDEAPVTPAVVAGLAAGAGPAKGRATAAWSSRLERWAQSLPPGGRWALFDLAGALEVPTPAALAPELDRALAIAGDAAQPERARIEAIRLVARGQSAQPLLELLTERSSAGIQQAAVTALQRFREPEVGVALLARWRTINPAVRPTVIAFLVDHHPFHEALVSTLENGEVTFAELNLDLEQRRELLRHGDAAVRRRAAKFFDDHEYSNRKKGVEALLAQLPAQGDPRTGFRVFMERCQMCHGRGPLGNHVGPDLLGLNHRSTEDLLSNIVDPNMAIHPNYVACTVVTKKGDRHTGLLRDENAESVSVLMPLGSLVSVPRSEVVSVTTLNRSLMPEGLETGLLPEELKGLIEFLQSKD